MFASAVCFSFGFFLGSVGIYYHQFWLLLLGYGVLGGIGLGLGYISPVSTLIKWFPDKPGMATGLAIMGFGGGAMIAAPLSVKLMEYFHSLHHGRPDCDRSSLLLLLCLAANRRSVPGAVLDFPHGQPFSDHGARDGENLFLVAKRQQCAGMPERKFSAADHLPNGRRQREQAEHVRYRRPLSADRFTDLLLGERETRDQFLITLRFFNRVQVAPLEILDEREREHRLIVELANVHRNVAPTEFLDRPETPLTGHEFKSGSARPDQKWLQQAICLNAGAEVIQLSRVEVLSGLQGVGRDRCNGNRAKARRVGRCRLNAKSRLLRCSARGNEQCVQPASQAPRFIECHYCSQ